MNRRLMIDCLTYDVHVRRGLDHRIAHAIESRLERQVVVSKPRKLFDVMTVKQWRELEYSDQRYQDNKCTVEVHSNSNIPVS
ncbi:hypothetical protein KY328_00250 [Candidatus Woesearchaeota archaeon]|nr:hypothetical protein [Candidatus Woesearchaeota archaeon]MBW3021328.1 hypothetical protein [Candidatus Woesearchaeota archaeon]